MWSSVLSRSEQLDAGPPEALPQEVLPAALPKAAPDHDALTTVVNAAIATHLFEHLSRMDSMEEQVNQLKEQLQALEKAPRALRGQTAEHNESDVDSPRTRRALHEGAARADELQELEARVEELAASAAEHRDLPTKEFLIDKFNNVEGEITMMREEAGIVRDHFIWFEKQIEKWRISWAMFALSATTMKESDRKDCMERLKEEESRLADAYFVSRIASTKTEDEALGECPSSRYVTTSASVSDRASTIKSFPLNSRSNTASSTKVSRQTAAFSPFSLTWQQLTGKEAMANQEHEVNCRIMLNETPRSMFVMLATRRPGHLSSPVFRTKFDKKAVCRGLPAELVRGVGHGVDRGTSARPDMGVHRSTFWATVMVGSEEQGEKLVEGALKLARQPLPTGRPCLFNIAPALAVRVSLALGAAPARQGLSRRSHSAPLAPTGIRRAHVQPDASAPTPDADAAAAHGSEAEPVTAPGIAALLKEQLYLLGALPVGLPAFAAAHFVGCLKTAFLDASFGVLLLTSVSIDTSAAQAQAQQVLLLEVTALAVVAVLIGTVATKLMNDILMLDEEEVDDKEESISVGDSVRVVADEQALRHALSLAGLEWDDDMRRVLGTTQEVLAVDEEGGLVGLKEAIADSGEPVWYYPLSCVSLQ
ncbi:unnamed protein product, partial [Prorocentrum cordatum]